MDNYIWTCWIDAKKNDQLVRTCSTVHTNFQKMWTKPWNYGQQCSHFLENSMNIRVYVWTFKWNQKVWTIIFKYGQYCLHFLENSMNIEVYAWTFKWIQKVWTIILSCFIIQIFVPVCHNGHFVMLVVDYIAKKVLFLWFFTSTAHRAWAPILIKTYFSFHLFC